MEDHLKLIKEASDIFSCKTRKFNSTASMQTFTWHTQYLEALGHRGAFYRRHLASDIKYSGQSFGRNIFKGLIKETTEHAGLFGNFTNRTSFSKRMSTSKIHVS